jgi:hypothetical protein
MKETLTRYDFIDSMQKYASGSFSYEGLEMLFDFLTEVENDSGIEIEFDPICFRSEFAESSVNDICSDYGIEIEEGLSESEIIDKVVKILGDKTYVIGLTSKGNVLYQIF